MKQQNSSSSEPQRQKSYRGNIHKYSSNPQSQRKSERISQKQTKSLQQQNQQNSDRTIQTTKPQKKNQVALGNFESLSPIFRRKIQEPSTNNQFQEQRIRISKRCQCQNGCSDDKCHCVKGKKACPNGCHCLRVNAKKKCQNKYNSRCNCLGICSKQSCPCDKVNRACQAGCECLNNKICKNINK